MATVVYPLFAWSCKDPEILDQRRLRGKRVKWMTAVRYICIEVKGSMCKSGFGIKSFQVPHEIKALGNGRWLNRGEIHTRVSLDLKISAFNVHPMLCPDVRYLAVCQSHHTSERVGLCAIHTKSRSLASCSPPYKFILPQSRPLHSQNVVRAPLWLV